MSPSPSAALAAADAHHLGAVRSVVSSAWHGLYGFATGSPWFAIVAMVPAVALLVGCTRLTVRRH
ncbi:hypothetical protein ACXR2U_07810 [Jatrophihabitans sp. YIM 134969]